MEIDARIDALSETNPDAPAAMEAASWLMGRLGRMDESQILRFYTIVNHNAEELSGWGLASFRFWADMRRVLSRYIRLRFD